MGDQNYILKALTDSLYSKLSLNIQDCAPIKIANFTKNLLELLRSQNYQESKQAEPFLIVLNTKNDGDGINIYNSSYVIDTITKGHIKKCNIITVDIAGNLIEDSSSILVINNLEELSDSFTTNNEVCFFIEGNCIDVVINGRTIKVIPDIFSIQKTRSYKNLIPISEYRVLINKHYNEQVLREKGFCYWSNKSERILVSRPERHFTKNLETFLSNFVSDGIVDEECKNAHTNDRTDIRITTFFTKQIYIIEIKWIGKSENTVYNDEEAQKRANVGILQLEEYLKDEKKCIMALLIIYDARENNEDITWDPQKRHWHAAIDKNPFILFLDSENASSKADKKVSKAKKKKK